MRTSHRVIAVAAALAVTTGTAAIAHHGWAWVDESKIFVLNGTVTNVYLGNPHAQMQVKTAEGTWIVDLAPLPQTTQAGFVKGVAKVGDTVTLVGHRSRSPDLAMKAKQVRLGGQVYNVYANNYPANVAS
jgi:hypothetical protein